MNYLILINFPSFFGSINVNIICSPSFLQRSLVFLNSQTPHQMAAESYSSVPLEEESFVVSGMHHSSITHLRTCIFVPFFTCTICCIAMHLSFCKSYQVREAYVPLNQTQHSVQCFIFSNLLPMLLLQLSAAPAKLL